MGGTVIQAVDWVIQQIASSRPRRIIVVRRPQHRGGFAYRSEDEIHVSPEVHDLVEALRTLASGDATEQAIVEAVSLLRSKCKATPTEPSEKA